jgi:hypothetical protein
MPDRAPYEDLPGQLDMWADFATPAANSVRAKNPPPEPDADGFFDAAGTTAFEHDDDIALEGLARGIA